MEFDRKEVKEVKDLAKFVSETEPGKKVSMLVWRDRSKLYLAVTVGERPQE